MAKANRNLAAIATLAAVYFLTGRLTLHMVFFHRSATAVWPLAGMSLAALLLFGYDLWPGILIGAFLANLTSLHGAAPLVAAGIAAGNTLEALAGAWLVNRFCGDPQRAGDEEDAANSGASPSPATPGARTAPGAPAGAPPATPAGGILRRTAERAETPPAARPGALPGSGRLAVGRTSGIFQFALLTGLVSSTIAASFGAASLALGGHVPHGALGALWATWWLGCGVSNIVVAPPLILWISQPRLRWRQQQFFEAAALLGSLVLVGLIVFDDVFSLAAKNYPLEYMCIPILLWAAYRFGPREASVATVVLAATAVMGTMLGFGPFARPSQAETLLLLQTFIGVVAVMTMGLATAFAERRAAELQTRLLAVSDPLTGVGNYRKLIDTLEAEIRRSNRTGRSFAVLLLDLDGLKQLNDVHGHLTGSRALVRLAEVLRRHSRSIDTVARYGGDEFALIVPETDARAARQIAERIAARTAGLEEQPPISVSVGAAVYPQDGESVETLLHAADLALYRSKRHNRDDEAVAEPVADGALPPSPGRP